MRVPGEESVRKKKEAGSWESERGMEENWDCQSDGDKVSLCLLSKYNFLHPTHPEEKYLSLIFFFFFLPSQDFKSMSIPGQYTSLLLTKRQLNLFSTFERLLQTPSEYKYIMGITVRFQSTQDKPGIHVRGSRL